MLRLSFVAVFCVAVACFGGCNKSKSTVSNEKGESQKPDFSTKSNDINSVKSVPPEGKGLVSPAKQEMGKRFEEGMDPSSVTSEYLKSLKNALNDAESLSVANELLTSKARSATNVANVDVSLPGTVNAKYVVHQAKYVTNEKNVAHVLTSWNDEVDQQPYEYDVTWVLKNEANVGWRVAGMITTGETEDDPVVFNFEDAADIVSKGPKETGPDASETRTAEKKSETEIR